MGRPLRKEQLRVMAAYARRMKARKRLEKLKCSRMAGMSRVPRPPNPVCTTEAAAATDKVQREVVVQGQCVVYSQDCVVKASLCVQNIV